MSEPVTVGWQVTDPEGNVVESGEVTVVEVDVLEEVATYMATHTPTEGEQALWQA